MKKLLIDTNIVLDLLARREPFYQEAAKLFSLADKKKVSLFVSALTFANVNYVLLKQINPASSRQVLRKLKLLVEIISLDEKIVDLALNDNDFSDFEDALQYYSAIENALEAILTRDLRGFRFSKLPVLTPGQINEIIES